MAKKKDHTGFRNGDLFCFNCGASYKMPLPQPMTMAAALMFQFAKDHKNCKKTWVEPVNEGSELKTETENAKWWAENGKIDLSDEVYILNVAGYVGDSTRSEILYALKVGKPITFLNSIMGKMTLDELTQAEE